MKDPAFEAGLLGILAQGLRVFAPYTGVNLLTFVGVLTEDLLAGNETKFLQQPDEIEVV